MKSMAWCLVVLSLLSSSAVAEEDVFITVTKQSGYDQALDELTALIANHDYTLIKIQPVDKGLHSRGYATSAYKVLFFGSRKQVDKVLAASPEASVLLPMRIILYKKGNMVVASTPSMKMWKGVFGNKLQPVLDQWEYEMRAILIEFTKAQSN